MNDETEEKRKDAPQGVLFADLEEIVSRETLEKVRR